jgi:hypothetical protein
LAGDEGPTPGGKPQLSKEVADLVARGRALAGQQEKGLGEERIAGEDGQSFAVNDMAGGTSAPQVIIIHAGQIVVNEGIGVDEFEGAGGWPNLGGGASAGLGGGESEERAEAFAPTV